MSVNPTVNIDVRGIINAINNMNSNLQNQINSMSSSMGGMAQQIATLKTTMESLQAINKMINSSIVDQTQLTRKIQVIQAEASKKASEMRKEMSKKDLIRKESRYKTQYKNIVNDYVSGIIQNIEHFMSLATDELKPLHKLIGVTNKLSKALSEMNPVREDKKVVAAALQQFKDRSDKFTKEVVHNFYLSEKKIDDYISLQEEMIKRFNNIKINDKNIMNRLSHNLSLLNIPVHVLEYTNIHSKAKMYSLIEPIIFTPKSNDQKYSEKELGIRLTKGDPSKIEYMDPNLPKLTKEQLKTQWKKDKSDIKKIKDKERRKTALKEFHRKKRLQKLHLNPKLNNLNTKNLITQQVFSKPQFNSLNKELSNLKIDQSKFEHLQAENLILKDREGDIVHHFSKNNTYDEFVPRYLLEYLEKIDGNGKSNVGGSSSKNYINSTLPRSSNASTASKPKSKKIIREIPTKFDSSSFQNNSYDYKEEIDKFSDDPFKNLRED